MKHCCEDRTEINYVIGFGSVGCTDAMLTMAILEKEKMSV